MNIKIRRTEERDIQGFWNAFHQVVNERKYFVTLTVPDINSTESFIKDCLKKDFSLFVAENNNMIIGWTDIIPNSKESLSHTGRLAIGILEKYRGKGIGTKLLSAAIDHALTKGLKRIELEVFDNNHAAIALYKNFGFQIEGTKKYACHIDGNYFDLLIMAKYSI